MALKKMRLKKDDLVQVIAGKEKGKKGKIITVHALSERVTIEKINMVKRHTKASDQNKQGGIIEKEASIHISNVMLLDNEGQRVRVRWKKLEDGKRVRVSAKTGDMIDKV